jgi:hypothetical protein
MLYVIHGLQAIVQLYTLRFFDLHGDGMLARQGRHFSFRPANILKDASLAAEKRFKYANVTAVRAAVVNRTPRAMMTCTLCVK